MNQRIAQLLAARLREPLPGAPLCFLPHPPPSWHREASPDARPAAVLLLLYPHNGCWHVPLTLRPSHLPDHAGQVSLPGGAIEPGETSQMAALREFHEELGADETRIDMLGQLSPRYVAVSNFRIEPWVGVCGDRPEWSPNRDEVEKLLEVPLSHLMDPANLGCHRRPDGRSSYTAPHFAWQSYRVWGATCAMLGEFVTVLAELTGGSAEE